LLRASIKVIVTMDECVWEGVAVVAIEEVVVSHSLSLVLNISHQIVENRNESGGEPFSKAALEAMPGPAGGHPSRSSGLVQYARQNGFRSGDKAGRVASCELRGVTHMYGT
jgi:hypothetical protein